MCICRFWKMPKTARLPLSSGKYPTGCERILLVDDEAPIARMVKMMLEKLGYLVTVQIKQPRCFGYIQSQPVKL